MDIRIGKRLRELRKSLGLTQEQFASRIPGKINYTYVGKIERGRQYPSLKLLEKIGRTYNVSLDFFFRGKNERAKIKRLQEELKKIKNGLATSR